MEIRFNFPLIPARVEPKAWKESGYDISLVLVHVEKSCKKKFFRKFLKEKSNRYSCFYVEV